MVARKQDERTGIQAELRREGIQYAPMVASHFGSLHGKLDDCPNASAGTWAQRLKLFDTMPCNLMPFIHRSYMPLNGRKMDPKFFGSYDLHL